MLKKEVIVFLAFFMCHKANSQSLPETVAKNIATKMKDSLHLTEKQEEKIYKLNLHLHDQKNNMRQQFRGTDSLNRKIQRVENQRDSLYRIVLTEQQYLRYKQKKRNLVSSN